MAESVPAQGWPLTQLPGLSNGDRQQLAAHGIHFSLDLLKLRSEAAQLDLAQQLRQPVQRVRKWQALAQLSHLPSVNHRWCGVLLHTGISSPQMLALQSPPQLHQRLHRLQRSLLGDRSPAPTLGQVDRWIREAQQFLQRR
ncbi:DUF4332 domain-containing protein [Synechococcus elongatus]|uniref:DUF4332 domain-containing protein n=1 Tax=Synechococcus sp. (strain ATCC 27144 / PCC 6301 / SAUG 1402/1) TaxID=269084 RepID=A0A0H3K517_SYNP6|nr:DUF4332 domain-containing protein [Synechococcus elongatus]MBD2586531.1 DUF4332 domain-containing protein [Synechococcus elongatus FACHB-242]MBD2687605.1 DUF4332 domain-containing protein [Synechococcus elongatus FACHB-1061]MBD2706686.1 DUF4332 domain-containing protein [Synechococcus elongatus PCC 7942 = FACHB-805]UOW71605.1 protein of unknown function DUF4332 [Synechococcus elongatus PCC 7943]UOW74325.1 protein of unknown function DUF4332 [Synechococcus elongatus PCC 6311]